MPRSHEEPTRVMVRTRVCCWPVWSSYSPSCWRKDSDSSVVRAGGLCTVLRMILFPKRASLYLFGVYGIYLPVDFFQWLFAYRDVFNCTIFFFPEIIGKEIFFLNWSVFMTLPRSSPLPVQSESLALDPIRQLYPLLPQSSASLPLSHHSGAATQT